MKTYLDPIDCNPSDRVGNPFLRINVPAGSNGYVEQSFTVPIFPGQPTRLSFLSWGWEGSNSTLNVSGIVNAYAKIVDAANVEHPLDAWTPPIMYTPGPPDVCTLNSPLLKSYDLSAYSGQTVKLRLGASSTNCCGTFALFDDVRLTDFPLTATPTSVNITAGTSGTSIITAIAVNSFIGTVTLSYSVSPSGLTCTLSPDNINLGAYATSILSCLSIEAGRYGVNVTGTSGSITHSLVVSFIVNPGPIANAITPSFPTITYGQSIPLTANPSQGTMPYSYQWYSDGVCKTMISGATSPTYLASPTLTMTYSYKVIDSAHSASDCSPGENITVEPDLIIQPPPATIYAPLFGPAETTLSGTTSAGTHLTKVEISTDGTDWFLASGTTSWSQRVTLSIGSNTVYVRATDDAGNTADRNVTINVRQSAVRLYLPWLSLSGAGVGIATASFLVRHRRARKKKTPTEVSEDLPIAAQRTTMIITI